MTRIHYLSYSGLIHVLRNNPKDKINFLKNIHTIGYLLSLKRLINVLYHHDGTRIEQPLTMTDIQILNFSKKWGFVIMLAPESLTPNHVLNLKEKSGKNVIKYN